MVRRSLALVLAIVATSTTGFCSGVSFSSAAARLTTDTATWAEKVLAVHAFARDEIREVKTSYS